MASESPRSKSPRRIFRVTLRALMIGITALCVFLGWYVTAVNRQKKAVAKLGALNAEILYMHDTDVGGQGEPPAPAWLVELLGVDYFSYPVVLYLPECKNEDLAIAADLRHIRKVTLLDRSVDDLRPLKRMKRLKTLVLFNSQIDQLGPIAELDKLEFLWLASSKIENLAPLKKLALNNLSKLFLTGEFATDMETLAELQGLNELRIFDRKSDFEYEMVGALTSLEVLWIQGAQITHLNWATELENLKKITVRKTNISDLNPLLQLSKLETVEIGRGQAGLSAGKVAELQAALPNCKVSHAW